MRSWLVSTLLLILVFTLLPGSSNAGDRVTSHLPKKKVEAFVVEKLDLATIRSSLNPRRKTHERTFRDVKIGPSSKGPGEVELKTADWVYKISILGRKDYNQDGIEDLAICFEDRALSGNYHTITPLLLTRYGPDDLLVGLAFEIEDARCRRKK